MEITSGKVVIWSVNGSTLFLHHCFCRLLVLKAQCSAELCASYVEWNQFWCLVLTGWGKTENGILGEIGGRRDRGDGRGKSQRWEY